jgi:hypothetical protein
MTDKYFVAPGAGDRFDTLVGNSLRLPLGHSAEDPDTDLEATLFWLVIPTRSGGELLVVHEGSGGRLVLLDDDENSILAGPSGGTLTYTVPPGKHGDLFVVASGGSPRKVSCTFTQTAIAREAPDETAKPLIPWNFYFWPSSRQFSDQNNALNPHLKTEDQMIAKYAKAFGKDVSAALTWEVMHHQRDVGASWVGHCHHSAAASILFEAPRAQATNSHGVAFNDEELKFLAAEWFGRFGRKEPRFALDKGANQPWDKILPDKVFTMLLKPSDLAPPYAKLEENLKRAIVAYKPDRASDAAQMAKYGTRPGFVRTAHDEFGRAAANFYRELNTYLLEQKHPLIADLRADGPFNGPNEVWNHVIFYYRATYKEILPSDPTDPSNAHFLEVELTLVANADVKSPPSSSQPAVPGPGNSLEVESSALENRWSRQRLWLAFDPQSGTVRDDPRNEWKYSRNRNGDDLYVPTYLAVVLPAGTTPGTATVNPDPINVDPATEDPIAALSRGNALVGLDLVAEPNPLLKVRQRYKR